MQTVWTRTACATDDLSEIWPALSTSKLNLEQVIVAVNEADEILGAILILHGGHAVAYVGEFTLRHDLRAGRRLLVSKRLIGSMLQWAKRIGIQSLLFTVHDPRFAALMLKAGAQALGQPLLFAAAIR